MRTIGSVTAGWLKRYWPEAVMAALDATGNQFTPSKLASRKTVMEGVVPVGELATLTRTETRPCSPSLTSTAPVVLADSVALLRSPKRKARMGMGGGGPYGVGSCVVTMYCWATA